MLIEELHKKIYYQKINLLNKNLDPRVLILGSTYFDLVHEDLLGFTPFQSNRQLGKYMDMRLIEDTENKTNIEVLGKIK
jgi:hypothetical protein